jgi:RNA polymerase sigma-70 factor (ECF subfamily)
MKHNARALQEGHQNSAENIEKKELELRVQQAIDALPEQCGKAFKLSRHHHLSYAEIAAAMDISVKTVENHMGKALSIMRSKLADYLISILICFILTQPTL